MIGRCSISELKPHSAQNRFRNYIAIEKRFKQQMFFLGGGVPEASLWLLYNNMCLNANLQNNVFKRYGFLGCPPRESVTRLWDAT